MQNTQSSRHVASTDAYREIASQFAEAVERLKVSHEVISPLIWRQLLVSVAVDSGSAYSITGIDVEQSYGGSPLRYRDIAKLFWLAGKHDLDLRDIPGVGHARIIAKASRVTERLAHVLSATVAGKKFCAVAITEEGAGSDVRAMETRAIAVQEGYELTGRKSYIARLQQATDVIVFARTRERDPDSVTAFALPIGTAGVSLEEVPAMGLRGVSFGSLVMNKAVVHHDLMIGKDGDGLSLFGVHFSYWRLVMAAAAIGCAVGSVQCAVSWLQSRYAFGKPLGAFSHLQQELSRHVAQLKMAWLLTVESMEQLEAGHEVFAEAAMAKAEAVEIALAASDWSIRIHGARGYTELMDLEKRVRDLYGLRVADGTTDVLRGQVARSLLGEELYEMSLSRRQKAGKVRVRCNIDDMFN